MRGYCFVCVKVVSIGVDLDLINDIPENVKGNKPISREVENSVSKKGYIMGKVP